MSNAVSKAIFKQCDSVSHILGSLSHPTRLKILCGLMDGEKSVMELTDLCGITQSAVSQFLARMKEDGLLVSRKEHQFVYYDIADTKLVQLLKAMKEIYC